MSWSWFWGLDGLSPSRIKHLVPEAFSIKITVERLSGGVGLLAFSLTFRCDHHLL